MTVVSLSAWVMITSGGLFAGGVLLVAVERISLWRRMPVEQYVVDFRRSLGRLDPLLPLLGGVSGIAGGIYAFNGAGGSVVMAWTAVALIAAVIACSLAIGEPINSKFRRLAEGEVPDEAQQLRATWRRFHLVRTVLVLAAFACIAAAAT